MYQEHLSLNILFQLWSLNHGFIFPYQFFAHIFHFHKDTNIHSKLYHQNTAAIFYIVQLFKQGTILTSHLYIPPCLHLDFVNNSGTIRSGFFRKRQIQAIIAIEAGRLKISCILLINLDLHNYI